VRRWWWGRKQRQYARRFGFWHPISRCDPGFGGAAPFRWAGSKWASNRHRTDVACRNTGPNACTFSSTDAGTNSGPDTSADTCTNGGTNPGSDTSADTRTNTRAHACSERRHQYFRQSCAKPRLCNEHSQPG